LLEILELSKAHKNKEL